MQVNPPPWTQNSDISRTLRVFSRNFDNINNISIKNIFSAISLKVSAQNQIAISQYHSQFTDQVLHDENWSLPFVQFSDMV